MKKGTEDRDENGWRLKDDDLGKRLQRVLYLFLSSFSKMGVDPREQWGGRKTLPH